MGILNRDSILSADDLPREEVQVPEWGGSVFVRTMNGSERDRFEHAWRENPGRDVRGRVAALTICDETGKPLFTEADVARLGTKSSAALNRILAVSMRLSGLTKQDVEELQGNS